MERLNFYRAGIWMVVSVCIIMTIAFIIATAGYNKVQKELAEVTLSRDQLAVEMDKRWANCVKMMHDPMIRRIMNAK